MHKKYQKCVSSLKDAREASVAGGGSVAPSRRAKSVVAGSVIARSVAGGAQPAGDTDATVQQGSKSAIDARVSAIQAAAESLASGASFAQMLTWPVRSTMKSYNKSLRVS